MSATPLRQFTACVRVDLDRPRSIKNVSFREPILHLFPSTSAGAAFQMRWFSSKFKNINNGKKRYQTPNRTVSATFKQFGSRFDLGFWLNRTAKGRNSLNRTDGTGQQYEPNRLTDGSLTADNVVTTNRTGPAGTKAILSLKPWYEAIPFQ